MHELVRRGVNKVADPRTRRCTGDTFSKCKLTAAPPTFVCTFDVLEAVAFETTCALPSTIERQWTSLRGEVSQWSSALISRASRTLQHEIRVGGPRRRENSLAESWSSMI